MGDVVAHQQHAVEARTVLLQEPGQVLQVRRVPHLHAEPLQGLAMAAGIAAFAGHEHHVRAFLEQQADQVELAQRGGIAVRLRQRFVQDQHLALPAMQQRRHRYLAGLQVLRQHLGPLAGEDRTVAYLVGLDPAAGVGAVAGALVVHHAAGRLHQRAQAGGAYREGQVGVLVVGRHVARVETAQRQEARALDRQRRAAAVVDVAQVGIARIVGRLEAAVAPGAAIGEDHAAGILQAAVGIQQLRADQAGLRQLRERVQQRVQPARLRHGVVVEEYQVAALRARGAVVAGGDEAAVALAHVVVQADDLRQPLRRVVAAAVVDHQDLAGRGRRMRGQRTQAGEGMRDVVVDRNHDADQRCGTVRHRERRERRRFHREQRALRRRQRLRMHAQPLPGAAPAARAQAGQAAPDQAGQAVQGVARIRPRHRHPVPLQLKRRGRRAALPAGLR
ncbi:hypothetical protein NB689_002407 [Xanthomonas sacchari]|nr:hypothetical protein [Xanthomonas sacchari]